MQKITTVLFDLDGVIVDSRAVIAAAWRQVAAQHAIAISDEQLEKYIIGAAVQYTLERIFHAFDADARRSIAQQQEQLEVAADYALLSGLLPFYRALYDRNVRMGMVTGSSGNKVRSILRQHPLAGFFCVVTGDDVAQGKPHPESYRKAMEFWRAEPQETLIFEDSDHGIMAARRAQAHCIAVGNFLSPARFAIGDFNDVFIADDGRIMLNSYDLDEDGMVDTGLYLPA
ncbi:HAD family hydrolase [Affinibrenneria salicis]|nr:HAD family phosphatase [Affinibrenneria salicis]